MKLRKRTLLTISLVVLSIILLLHAAAYFFLLNNYVRLEEQNTRLNVQRALDALSNELTNINRTLGDWANWDDPYYAMESGADEFIQANMMDETLANLHLNLILLIDISGHVVYGKAFDLLAEQEVPLPPSLSNYVGADLALIRRAESEGSVVGTVLLDEGPMLVAAQPILTSNGKGPSHGTLVFGRYLDAAEIEQLSEQLHMALAVFPLNDPQPAADISLARTHLSDESPIFVASQNARAVSGYALLKDVDENPALALRVDLPRDIYRQGRANSIYFFTSTLIVGLVSGAATMIFLEWQILRRLSRLSSSVSGIGGSGDTTARVLVEGRDELSSLAHEINAMLETIEHSEMALRENEQRYRLLAETARDTIIVYDIKGRITYINKNGQTQLGYSPTEVLGLSIADIIPPKNLVIVDKNLARCRDGNANVSIYESVFCTRSGRRIPVEISSSPIFKDQNISGMLLVVRDITERKQAEKELHKLATAVEHAAEAIVLVDQDAVIQYINPAFERITGYTRQEALQQPLRMLGNGISETAAYRGLYQALQSGTAWEGHLTSRKKDGTAAEIEVTISPLRVPDEQRFEYILTVHDVTQRMALEGQLRQTQKIDALGQLAGGIAHDFNNLLTAIMGHAGFIAKTMPAQASWRTDLEGILAVTDRAAQLTRQLLAFSRKQVVEPRVLRLNDLVRNLEKMMRRLIREDIVLSPQLEVKLGMIKADPGQIEQVIVNLVVNARDAMPQGGKLTLTTANVELDEAYVRQHVDVTPGPYVMLAVSDTGTGMDKETKAHIFEPFFTTKEKGKGTGLGLATVYGIVRQSGGHIDITSEPGQGTTFAIYFPRSNEPISSAEQKTPPDILPHGSGCILLVEDAATVRRLARRTLEMRGYAVLEASSPVEALRIISETSDPIQLLVTDVVMPGMKGPELAGRLLALRPEIKVLYMSGYVDALPGSGETFDPKGAFLSKPFTPEGLLRQVREILDQA